MNCECHLLKRLFNEYLAKNLDKKITIIVILQAHETNEMIC